MPTSSLAFEPSAPPSITPTTLAPIPTTADAQPAIRWGLAKKVAFRFSFVFFPLPYLQSFMQMLPESWKPDFSWAFRAYDAFDDTLANWVAVHVLGITTPLYGARAGSGDGLFNYVEVASQFLLAMVIAAVWSVIDRRRAHYQRLWGYLRVYLRYALAAPLVSYGMEKVLCLQMPTPTHASLFETYGNSSPMRLLWTFMGYSRPYEIFGGLAEVAGGLLLIFRRTTLLGTLIVSAVMTNVVMLNFCYDVPVKIYSSTLLLTALFLTLPDAERLLNVLLLNRTATPAEFGALTTGRRSIWVWRAAKLVAIWFVVVQPIQNSFELRRMLSEKPTTSPVAGFYKVDTFLAPSIFMSSSTPAPTENPRRWSQVEIADKTFFVRYEDGVVQRFIFQGYEPEQKRITLLDPFHEPEPMTYTLAAEKLDENEFVLSGTFVDGEISARLRRTDEPSFPLMTRGFRWVSDFPYNR